MFVCHLTANGRYVIGAVMFPTTSLQQQATEQARSNIFQVN
jgi:hypothetical protein